MAITETGPSGSPAPSARYPAPRARAGSWQALVARIERAGGYASPEEQDAMRRAWQV